MKLYLLRPVGHGSANLAGPWNPWYDKAFGFVIRAKSEAKARDLADKEAGDENYGNVHPWLDPTLSTCIELIADGEPGIVLRDFAAA